MKKFNVVAIGVFILCSLIASAQSKHVLDLQKLSKTEGLQIYNRKLSLINEKGYSGIRLSKEYGEGVAWIKDFELSNGIIEFDVRGENIKQGSFVGIAFHGVNDSTFDAVYLRPFRFTDPEPTLRNHGIQYISLPEFTWRHLRGKFPDVYEHIVEPAPDPNSWVHVRLEIKDQTVTTYINNNPQGALIVQKLTAVKKGMVGLYVADTSGGDFANLVITKID